MAKMDPNAQTLATISTGDTVRYGKEWNGTDYVPQTTVIVAADERTVTVANPDAGRVFSNRNRAPKTVSYKRTSKRLAALTGLPIS